MREIDLTTWERRTHFEFFRRMAYPIYNISFEVDVTEVKAFSVARGLSFNLAMVHLSTATLNGVDNFKYRVRGEKVVLHDVLTPSYAHLEEGAELFKMITVPFEADLGAFERSAKQKAALQAQYFDVTVFAGRDDFVFYSALPWISFTSVDHTVNLEGDDAIPRISWGKYFEKHGRLMMPYNLQVNHMFVDGYHLGLFKEGLDRKIDALG